MGYDSGGRVRGERTMLWRLAWGETAGEGRGRDGADAITRWVGSTGAGVHAQAQLHEHWSGQPEDSSPSGVAWSHESAEAGASATELHANAASAAPARPETRRSRTPSARTRRRERHRLPPVMPACRR